MDTNSVGIRIHQMFPMRIHLQMARRNTKTTSLVAIWLTRNMGLSFLWGLFRNGGVPFGFPLEEPNKRTLKKEAHLYQRSQSQGILMPGFQHLELYGEPPDFP